MPKVKLVAVFDNALCMLTSELGDEKGHIIAWRYAEGMMFGSCPAQEQIFTMALSYVLEGELAVG